MGKEKAGFLTPKAISNRIKAKGLQKLRWYCQMCQKQCRDENGFKCHTMSESHQRQLLLVADNPHKFVDTFSKDFSDAFINLLSRRFGTKRVHCNVVYQEYIADRNHTHMNSTRWLSLTEYVKWLGRKGICTVDETEKGWFVQYIDRSPEAIMRQQDREDFEKARIIELEMEEKRIKRMVEKGAKEYEKIKKQQEEADPKLWELNRTDEDEKIVFKMPAVPKAKADPNKAQENILIKAAQQKKEAEMNKLETSSRASSNSSDSAKRKLSALEEIKQLEEKKRARFERRDHWIVEGIIVKVVTKKAGEEFYNKKAVIEEVKDKYEAVVCFIDDGDKAKFHQSDLRTVLPAIGKQVQLVNGPYRGCKATLKSIEEDKYSCTICLESGNSKGKTVSNVDYEDICKIF